MGKRTRRYLHHQLKESLPIFDQKELQLICWNGSTFMGIARIKDSEGIEIQDKNIAWYNRKKHTHYVPLSEVKEVVIDEISSW